VAAAEAASPHRHSLGSAGRTGKPAAVALVCLGSIATMVLLVNGFLTNVADGGKRLTAGPERRPTMA
jgi:hypothetical protein